MRLKARHDQKGVIPTASMADIAFLLIVFFMVTITFEKDKTQVALPKTELRFEVPKVAAYISVTEQGQIRVTDGEAMSTPVPSVDEVGAFAADLVRKYPTRPVVLKADGDVQYQQVDRILDELKQANVELIYLLSEQKTVDGDGQSG
ncbi:MAG: biopolymer transporter ExbD [Thermoanaerobaculia bacterium]|nr:biopolymer transporter ExbD [Thermoanaerobaculia bacterium]